MNLLKKIWSAIISHKKTSIVVVIVIAVGIYYYHTTHTATATTYIVKPASIGTIQTTVSGTGQVASSQELTVYPQVSGTVLSVNVKDGDTVSKGEVLATLDSTNAYYSLENAKIALEKLQTSSPISATSDQNTYTNAESTLNQSYITGFNEISSAYNDMGPIITNLNDMFYGKNISPYFTDTSVNQNYGSTALGYKQSAGVLLDKATAEYNSFRPTYLATILSSTSTIDAALSQEIVIAQDLSAAADNTATAINYIINQTSKNNRSTSMTSDQNNVSSWSSTASQDESNLSSAINGIQSAKQTWGQAGANLTADQTTNSPLDLQSAELTLEQAQTTYDEYTITAPFDGVIGNVTLQPGDTAGGSTAIGTIVTKQYQSTIVLNEVDVAKVAVGQPVTITFNALPNSIATGTVTDVDAVGTVSQGVVSYNVIVSFNSDDPQIKAGMSINADIVTAEVDNVVVVPNAAIKTIGGRSYVQVPAGTVTPNTSITTAGFGAGSQGSSTRRYRNASSTLGTASSTYSGYTGTRGTTNTGGTVTTVTNKLVQIGLTDDTNTQIISGINAGDLVVTQTITGTAAKAAASTNILSSLTGGGTRTGGGGGFTGGGSTRPAASATAGK